MIINTASSVIASTTRYVPLDTQAIASRIENAGFTLTHSSVIARDKYLNVRRHLLRFRKNDALTVEYAPELLVYNSNDKDSALQMKLGIYRDSSLDISRHCVDIRIPHNSRALQRIDNGLLMISLFYPLLCGEVSRMQATKLTLEQRQEFAGKAFDLKFPTKTMSLNPRNRSSFCATCDEIVFTEDEGNDLWHVYRRTHERILNGKFKMLGKAGNSLRASAITRRKDITQINTKLWILAASFLL